jgi:cardiolipin synthase (CMP-forming)
MRWRYLPNMITSLRLIVVVPFIYFILNGQYAVAFWIFILASISDGLDGYLARKFQWQSRFGAFCDPLADKLLVVSSYIALTWNHHLPLWFTVLMVTRDVVIIVGALAWYRLFRHIEFKPTFISKANTVFQLMLIIVILFEQAFGGLPFMLIEHLILMTTLTTAFSFIDYVVCWSLKAIKQK